MVTVPSRGPGGYRRAIGFALRFGLAAAVVGWLVHEAGWEEIAATLGGADPWLLLAATVAVAFESVAKAWNWGRLLDYLGCRTTRHPVRLMHAYMVGTLAGTVLPSTASTDAMRALLAQRRFGGRPTAHAAAIVISNLMVWMAACSIGLVCMGVLAASGLLPSYKLLAAPLFAGVVVVGVGLHVALKYYRAVWLLALRRLLRRRWFIVRRAIRRFADSLLIFERAHVRFAPSALLSLLAATSSALVFAAVASAVGVDVPLAAWGVIMPLVSLSNLLPISIAGLGGAQAVHVLLLAPFGVSVPQAFAASALLALLNVMFTAVFGSLLWLFGPDVLERAPAAAASAIDLPERSLQALRFRPRK